MRPQTRPMQTRLLSASPKGSNNERYLRLALLYFLAEKHNFYLAHNLVVMIPSWSSALKKTLGTQVQLQYN